MIRLAVILSVILLAGCGDTVRRYRLELEPLPAGADRRVSGNMQVAGKPETFEGSLPLIREWHATSFSGELTSPGEGGMHMRLLVLPEGSSEREIVREGSGPHGVRGRIIERGGEVSWGIELQVTPLVAAPAAGPAPAAAPAAPAAQP